MRQIILLAYHHPCGPPTNILYVKMQNGKSIHKCDSFLFCLFFISLQLTAATAYGYPEAAEGDAKGEEDMKENLLSVIVYFQSLNIRYIEESIKYDIIAVIYAVGGSISLFLGISIAMIFEVFELMLDCLINLFFHCSGSQEKKKSALLKV